MKKISLIALLTLVCMTAAANRESKKLHKLLDQIIQVQSELSPQTANWLGDKSQAGKLDHVSAAQHQTENQKLQPLLNQLNKIKVKKLAFQDRVSLQMQQRFLQQLILLQ